MEWAIPILLVAAVAAPGIHRALGRRTGIALAIVPAGIALHAALLQGGIAEGVVPAFTMPWVPSIGIHWSLRLDGLSNLFVLLIAGIGALITVYAKGYFGDDPRLGRFYSMLFVFMTGMVGVASADDLFLLFVFWELTTISSFLLIGFDSANEKARSAARQSLLVTGAGGLAMLTGFLLLASAAGTSSISALIERGDAVRAHAHYPWILSLVLIGAFTKSAQVPFHFWLPAAMKAPTPVSAYLHSSTMVKAGVFLLARLSPVLGGTEPWFVGLSAVGAATMLTGATMSTTQDDLKRALAYSTLSVLGLLVLLLGLGTPVAARAFAVTLLAHALYKGTLFLVAGNVDKATGTRSLRKLVGLRTAMPWTAAAGIVAGISMGGAPPLFGFLAKETAYEAVFESPRAAWILGIAAVASAAMLVSTALRVGFQPFAGRRPASLDAARDIGFAMRVGPVALATAGVVTGLLVGPAERVLIAPAASAILQEQAPTGLALWHGFTPILAVSALTLAIGAALYASRRHTLRLAGVLGGLARFGPARIWEGGWDGLLRGASWQTRTIQNGSLRRYLAVTLCAAFAAVWYGIAGASGGIPETLSPPVSSPGAAAALLIAGGAVGMLLVRAPFAAVACLGAVGLGVALLFLAYSAPDLALTQLVVEVLTVVLLVFVLRRLPPPRAFGHSLGGVGGIALAALGGATMAGLTLWAAATQRQEPISDFFLDASVTEAHGRNVVNVILVDFRALDTLGEITVLAVAALGILAVLARATTARDSRGGP